MAEQKRDKHYESASNSNKNTSCHPRTVANRQLYKWRQDRRGVQESIFTFSSVNQLQNFHMGAPLWQPAQPYNLIYGNISQAVLQPHLCQNYFHRPWHENQRQLHCFATNVAECSLNGLRYWEKLSQAKKSGFNFTVMSYNVLAQNLLDQHPHLYSFHDKKYLKWKVRSSNLKNEIRHFQPDILCLQEVQKSHVETFFSSTLSELGYKGLYKQRTGVRTDGCAIYYKPSLLKLVEYTTVEYNQPNVRILDRDNVAIIAKFSPRNNPDKEFVISTTHLLYNPKRQDVRLAQIQLLLTELDRLAFTASGQYLPVIMTGDLNSTPDSAVYEFITRGKLRYENLSSRSLQSGGAGPKTGKEFLPAFLRITDQCQHADLLSKRKKNVLVPRSEELGLIELKHSERKPTQLNKDKSGNNKELFASGTLTHNFCFKSVYQHSINGDVEGTTYQDEWLSVDYIFFSKPQPTKEGLLLLERYRLPTKRELRDLKIPNTNLGSDHFSLLAKFQLQI